MVKCRRMKRPQFMGIRIQCNTENFVPIVVPRLSTNSSSSSSTSTPMTSSTEVDHSDHPPAIVSSGSVDRWVRRDPYSSETSKESLNKPTKIPKPNNIENHEQVRGDPYYSDKPELLQDFRENLVDDRVLEHRDSHASSSLESSLEPTRSVDLGKHSVHTHFPKDRNCEICQRPKITRAPYRRRNGGAVPRAENCWWSDYSRSQSSQWHLRISKQSPMCSRGAGLGHPLDPVVSMQNKNFTRNPEKLVKVPGAEWEAWSHLHWQLLGTWQSLWTSVLESLYVNTTQIGNEMGLLREQYAEWKKVRLLYCCNQVWMKNGGQILWNVTPICETSQIYCLMGRRPMKDVLGNHLKDRSFRLVHWLSISLFLRRTSQESINLEGKSYLDCSLDTLCTRGEFGRVTWCFADIEELETMHASETYSKKTQCKGSNISPKKWKNEFLSRRWRNIICRRRSGTENIHLDTGPPNWRRRSKRFSWRIRRVSTFTTSRLTSGCRWSDKWFLINVRNLHIPPSRWTQSETLLVERRIIPYSTEIHWRLQDYSYELECHARKPHRWLLENRWIKIFVWFCKDNTSQDPTRFLDVKYARIWDTDSGDDDRTKSDCNIQKKRTLYLDLRMRGEMKLTYKTFLLNVETSDTNDNVKTKINTKHMKPDNDVTHLVNTWMCE